MRFPKSSGLCSIPVVHLFCDKKEEDRASGMMCEGESDDEP